MEFGFTKEQEKLRKEIHDFYTKELPSDIIPRAAAFTKEVQGFWKGMAKKAVERGFYVPGWPKEYGGQGFGHIEQGIVNEEEGYFGIAWPATLGLHMLAPALLIFGTDEQKKKYVTHVANGEGIVFQCFTEPDAGSDESNMQTRAVLDGDDYVFNGSKIYISGTYKPDYLYALARTEDTVPKHRGISLFVVDAHAPGITYRPLLYMGGGGGHEVFFDDVRVPKGNIIGQVNRGFYHAMQVFEFERTGTATAAGLKQDLTEFIEFCKATKRNGKSLWDDPKVKDTAAQIASEIEMHKIAAWETQWRFSVRERLGSFSYGNLPAALNKINGPRHAKAMLDIMGLYGQLRQGSKWVKLAGRLESRWRASRSMHAGGSLQIQKMVLAERGLGLTRIPSKLRPVIGQAIKEATTVRA
jgi:hypothetical protein